MFPPQDSNEKIAVIFGQYSIYVMESLGRVWDDRLYLLWTIPKSRACMVQLPTFRPMSVRLGWQDEGSTMVLVERKVNLVPVGSALTGTVDQSFFQFRRSIT
jgi:hypothetical protein